MRATGDPLSGDMAFRVCKRERNRPGLYGLFYGGSASHNNA